MKVRSWFVSLTLLLGLALALTFIPQGIAQNPTDCAQGCVTLALEAAEECRGLGPGTKACLQGVVEEFELCLIANECDFPPFR